MSITKSHWVADENRVSLSLPISKIDEENRLVSGFATLDNIDTSDDIVTAEASKAAFEAAKGNIREMHQPIAAGRLVNFTEEEYFHDGEFYRGIYATAYVSKGAEDTWQKVLDGTLSGFSIGGNITDQETKFVKDAGKDGKTIRFIKGYDLIELSLVDNPANQLANVFSIVKSKDGSTMLKGMVSDTIVYNVFWCGNDEIAKNSKEESENCISCGSPMEQIGWFERGGDEAVKTASVVAKFLRHEEANDTNNKQVEQSANNGGGVDMSVKNTKKIDKGADEEEVVSEEVADVVVEEVVSEEAAVEEAAEVVEAEAEPDFEKMFDDLKDSVRDSVQKTIETVEAKVTEANKRFDDQSGEVEKSLVELREGLDALRTERADVAKRLETLEKASAIKKSGEVETEPVTKSQKTGLWGGTFFDSE